MTEWGTAHEPDPDELVDFMTMENCGPVRFPVVTPHPVPLHEPEEGLLDEEILPLWWDWQRGPVYNPVDSGFYGEVVKLPPPPPSWGEVSSNLRRPIKPTG